MSWIKEPVRYLETRFPATQFIPLAVLLAAAGLAPAPPAQPWYWLAAVALALSLLLQLRLWDDIADRDRDREIHPGRVLCMSRDLRPFLLAAAALFVLNGTLLYWLHGATLRITGFLVLCTGLLAWYRLRPRSLRAGLLNSGLVLLKYPVIAWLAGVPAADTDLALLLSCLCSVYLVFIVFELLDDNSLGQGRVASFMLGAGYALLLAAWAFIAFPGWDAAGTLFRLAWGVIIIATLAHGLAGLAKPEQRPVTRGGRGIFIVGLLAYVVIAVENSL